MRPSVCAADVEGVATYLSARVGVTLTGPRREHLLRQLTAAMDAAGAVDGRAYCAMLDASASAFDAVVARVTVGESYFFREPHQLDVVRSTILPDRQQSRGASGGLQLWSAGCAIGQEPYTLAILLEEAGVSAQSRVLGTDLSREALQVAKAGVYGEWSLRSVSPQQRATYFDSVATGFQIASRFAQAVTFRQLNLLDAADPTPRDVDVILCRNVLIYFTPEAIERAAHRLRDALAPGGWLVTGSSDPPLQDIPGLQMTRTSGGVMYRRCSDTEPAPVVRRVRSTVPAKVAARPAGRSFPRLVAAPAAATAPPADNGEDAVRRIRDLGGSGDLTGAADAAQEAVERFPVHHELRFLQAVVLLEVGRPADAATAARAALYLDPTLVVAHLALARAEVACGRAAAARRSLRNATTLLRDVPDDAVVPLSDGEPAGRLAAMAAAHDRALAASEPAT